MKVLVVVVALAASVILLVSEGISQQATDRKNPYQGDAKAVAEGAALFTKNCQACHGAGGKGDICPNLTTRKKKYGDTDADLFLTISRGRPGGMPNWENALGRDRIWKVITYLRSIEEK